MSTTVTPASYSSRITGLFSDMDTDAIVKRMCAAQQAKIDRQEQKGTSYEWYGEAVNKVIDQVKKFQNTYCSALGSSSMLQSSTYYSYSVSAASTGKAVTLSASSLALEGDYSVKVLKLAENAAKTSAGKVSANGKEISASNMATLGQLALKNQLQFDQNGEISFSINGKNFTFNKETTLQNMINTVNTDADANVTMKYSRLTDTFTITADEGGKTGSVYTKNISGNAFGESGAFMISEGIVTNGRDAIAEINGVTVTRNSNEFSIDDVTFELKAVTAGTDEETLDFSVKRDYSATVDAIATFVDAFNELITSLTALTSAKSYAKDYPPLTTAQKEEMTEEQIKTWEEKAKNGVLRGDSTLESLVSQLKNAFFSAAGGTGKSAVSLGISGSSYYGGDKGLITVDRDALAKALEANPEEVVSIFTNGSISAAGQDQGLIYKMRGSVTSFLKSAGESVGQAEKKVDGIKGEIGNLADKLDELAERYYRQFSQMETALAALNSDTSFISQLFSS